MAKRCDFCGKGPMAGHTYSRRGQAKAKGGVGIKTARVNPRRFLPNLKHTRIFLNGRMKKVSICTKCLKAGRLIGGGPTACHPAKQGGTIRAAS